MLEGTVRQEIWHVLMGLVVPNKSSLPSWATLVQATEMCSPASPGALPSWGSTRQVSGSIGTSLHGGLKNILGFCRGQGYKQNRQISPPGSQQLSHQCLTATLHPGTPPQLNCPELCPRACPVPNPGDEQVSDQSHGLLSQQQELSVPVHPSP